MSDATGNPRLLFPQLQPFYDCVAPYVYPMFRFAAGAILVPHGWVKVQRGVEQLVTGSIGKIAGEHLALPMSYFLAYLELVGGAMVAVGLLTRFVAAAIAIEFAVITFAAHWARGFFAGGGGYEFPLLWGVLFFGIALRGGGWLSVDRKLSWEL
jgi:putative oxidoreductase